MNKLASTIGVAVVLATGYYAVLPFSGSSEMQTPESQENATLLPAATNLNRAQGQVSLSPLSMATRSAQTLPPHEQNQTHTAPGLSPEDEAARNDSQAEMIASLRANNMPEEQIAQMEQALKDQESASNTRSCEPPEERTSAELGAELRESLKQSGEPPEIIEAMARQIEAGATTNDDPVLPHKKPIPGS